MAEFTDFYELLNLNRNDSAEDLKKELVQLETTWHRREIANPEKASRMLVLIMDAKNVFQNEQSKREYDQARDESKRQPAEADPGPGGYPV